MKADRRGRLAGSNRGRSSSSGGGGRGRCVRPRRSARRDLRFEPLEERQLLAVGPQLIAINPNNGEVLTQGEVRHVAPQELIFRFDENQVINPATLGGIQIVRSGLDGVFGNGNDVAIVPGFVDVREQPNEVLVRFSDALPDDLYRVTIIGAGPNALRNVAGEPFNGGTNWSLTFELDLGAQVTAVVPQPTGRAVDGTLVQARDKIVVYFNDDNLYPTAVATGQLPTNPAVVDPAFYQLIFTNDTVTNTDDQIFTPTQVSYDPLGDLAVLTFASDLAALPSGPGTYRLRIGTDEGLPLPPTTLTIGAGGDPGSSLDTALDLGALGAQGLVIDSAIDPQFFPLDFPGSNDEPGHRDIPVQNHLIFPADGSPGIATMYYNFQSVYGADPLGNTLYNLITPAQKDLARRIFDIYSYYIGVQFIESANQGLTIVTGDLRAIDPGIDTGPGGTAGLADPLGGIAIMDNAEDWSDTFGGDWFTVAFHEIGHLMGLGHTYELPVLTIMGDDPILSYGQGAEPVFPGDQDIVHGQYVFRPEGNDIDLYRFTLSEEGKFSAQTFAERLQNSSNLDTVISLYRDTGGQLELVARNDDYYSEDSFIEVDLGPGAYAIAVSASGDREFDLSVEDTGLFGTSDGKYQLRVDFRPREDSVLVDATGTALDGDGDGLPGGEYNFWFRAQTLARTRFVDKAAPAGGDGSMARPYRTLVQAFAAAQFGDVVRVVPNGGADGNIATPLDSAAFQFGFNELGQPLEDGATVKVPRGVTVMIDAGTVFKAQDGAIEVGSSAPGVDRSAGALQVLGTTKLPVYFTSYNDETIGRDTNPAVPQTPTAGDWGGIIFRSDLDHASPGRVDYEALGIFLNYVNHADMRFGGGQVKIDSRDQVVTPIQMIDSRPTITFNTILASADAALAASPDSFEETDFQAPKFQTVAFTSDYRRVGPEIQGNRLFNNTINGLFIRIRTPAGDQLRPLTVAGRFDDTDVVHVLSENLVIQGTPGGPLYNDKTGLSQARLDARLVIDPGTVVKLDSAHIRVDAGGQLIAEGIDGRRVVFTSLADDSFGAGGNFDTNGDQAATAPAPGDWGGIYFGHTSIGSIDQARLRYGGGVTRLQSEFAGFNVVEIHQADVRIANSIFEFNDDGMGGQAPADRFGLMSHSSGTIFVRGAQPVIVDNVIRHNAGPAITINVNSLNHFVVTDFGRSTGMADRVEAYGDNRGPLVRDNRLLDNDINGMLVRGGTLTTQSYWDDTSIVHVLTNEVIVPDFHTYGGLFLVSSPNESLVVKLSGQRAGFTAAGRPLDIDDRIGGMVYVLGQPGSPVVLTSLADDTVGAGALPDGTPNTDTNNDADATQPAPGDWRSVQIQQYSHDRNVAVYTERELGDPDAPDSNATPDRAEFVGTLAPDEKGGDDNRRLGFTILGYLPDATDVDVYSFQATAGTEIWIDVDQTSQALDTVIELIDRNGNVIARSDNSLDESSDPSLLVGAALPMQKLPPYGGLDFLSVNPKDAGMRVVLPDSAGTTNTYHVRIRSKGDDLEELDGGETCGVYQLQVRLRELDEFAGSNIRFADIRYATNGIEVLGQPIHSPLTGEAGEDGTANDTQANAQDIGNLLESDRAALAVAGSLATGMADVDFYRFEVTYTAVQGQNGDLPGNAIPVYSTVFDLDYSDGLARGNIILSVFDSQGRLVLTAGDSNVADDLTVGQDGDIDDLARGSLGPLDPFLGNVELPQGEYYVAVSAASRIAQELEQFVQRNPVNPLVRLEPIDSTIRIVEDHVSYSGGSTAAPPVVPTLVDAQSIVPYFLGDVVLFVSVDTGKDNESRLLAVNPFTGAVEVVYGTYGRDVGDIAMRMDNRQGGDLLAFTLDIEDNDPSDGQSGNFLEINTGTGGSTVLGDDGIVTYEADAANPTQTVVRDTGIQFEAMTFGTIGNQQRLLAIGYRADMFEQTPPAGEPHAPRGVTITRNILYRFDPSTGAVLDDTNQPRLAGAGTDAVERGEIFTSPTIVAVDATRIQGNNTLFDIFDGLTFTIDDGTAITAFEFDSGPEANVDFNLNQNQRIEDGEFFILDGQLLEFDTGRVIEVTGTNFTDGADITDGAVITIQDDQGQTLNLEFDNNNNVGGGNTALTFPANATAMANAIAAAINAANAAGNFNAQAAARGTRVSVTNDIMIDVGTATGVRTVGEYGTNDPTAIAIPIEENFTPQQARDAIVTGVNNANLPVTAPGLGPTVTAGTRGTRVNFAGATTADFSGTGDFTDVGSTGGTADPTAVPIPFLADDTAATIALRIQRAINTALGPGVTATSSGGRTSILGALSVWADAPLTVVGEGPGGTITGMAILNGQVYCVSDAGGLWRIDNPLSTSPVARYIGTSAADLVGIPFAGLTAGPRDVEGGLYSGMLFGISEMGTLYAFDTTGALQPIFVDAASSVGTGYYGEVQGLAFSSLDENLFHITGRRDTNPGHGLNRPFDGSRASARGGLSFYFGRDYTNPDLADYDTPGGAHGTIITDPFDLSDYSAADQPVLYFNYFAVTEEASYNPVPFSPMKDSFRVYISEGDDGPWHLLATNDSYRGPGTMDDEFDDPNPLDSISVQVQELYDFNNPQSATWRQVRVPLDSFAGMSDLRLRFEYTTAGSSNLGDDMTTGSELRAVPGSELRDGDTFTIGDWFGFNDILFEFDSGYTVVLPGGASINDGDTVTVTGPTSTVVYEFDNDGTVGDTLVTPAASRFRDGDTFFVTDGAATELFEFDSGYSILVPFFGGDPFFGIAAGDQFVINDNAGSGDVVFEFTKGGLPGTGDVNIEISDWSTQDEIADLVVQAISGAGLGLAPLNLGYGEVFVGGTTHTLDTSGSLNLGQSGQPGAQNGGIAISFVPSAAVSGADLAPVIVQAINGAGLNLVASASGAILSLEGDGAALIPDTSPLAPLANTVISFSPDEPAADVASRFASEVASSATPYLNGNRVNLPDAIEVTVTPGSGIRLEGLPGAQHNGFLVEVNEGMTTVEVANAVADAIAVAYAGFNDQIVAQDGSQLAEGDAITVGNGTDTLVIELDGGYMLTSPPSGGAGLADGETFTISNAASGASATFEFDKDGLNSGTNIIITVDDTMSPRQVGTVVTAAINGAGLGLTALHVAPGVVHLGGTVDDLIVNQSALVLSGLPGAQIAGAVALPFVPSTTFTADQTASALEAIINAAGLGITATASGRRVDLVGPNIVVDTTFSTLVHVGPPTNTVKRFDDIVKVIGHQVLDPGKLGLTNSLSGDMFGAFNSAERAQANGYEGVYVDDLIIGFAERGEMVTGSNQNTAFRSNPQLPANQILEGPYQLEIRGGTEYGTPIPFVDPAGITLVLFRSFDTNDRLTQAVTLVAPSGDRIADGQTFTLGDGLDEVTFTFRDDSLLAARESGDDLATATETGLTAGSSGTYSSTADIGDGLDVDFFAFDLAAGDTVSIDIDIDGWLSPLDSVLRLFDANGVELAVSDDDPAPGELADTDSYIEFTALSAGRYYVGVSGFSNFYYDPFVPESGIFGFNSTGDYSITILLNGGAATTDDTVIPFTNEDTAAEIAKRIVAAINSPTVQEILDVRAASNPNSARIDLSGSVVVGAGFAPNLDEPNDTLAQAFQSGIAPTGAGALLTRGEIGDSVGGLSPGLDVDLIRVELSAFDTITIDVDAAELGSPLDSVVRLFDASGMELAYSDDAPAPGEAFTVDSFLQYTVTQDGVYYVGISGFSNWSYDPNVAGSGTLGSTGFYQVSISRGAATPAGIGVIFYDDRGDTNLFRDQGQLLIESNFISYCEEFGIVVDAGQRVGPSDSPQPHQGPVRVLAKVNTARLVPGTTIVNNVVAFNGAGGIKFSGDTNPANGQFAPIPYGRILNNTIYGVGGGDVGILIEQNAGPTVLNNIMAHLGTGLQVDGSSSATVLGGLLFKDNGTNSTAGLGNHAIVLAAAEPLFVDPSVGNFYLSAGSRAIDSAVKSLEDRPQLTQVRQPLDIDNSPVLAPEVDVFGLLRVDDPSMKTPAGLGETVFIDRGAIDRVDFDGPLAELVTPVDSDKDTFVQSNQTLREFVIQLNDGGVGVADTTVDRSKVLLLRNGVALVEGQDYTFRYDETNDQIRLTAGTGVWTPGTYQILLNNSAAVGIKDMADNPLQANQLAGNVQFTIMLGGGADFGDAPAPYPTLRPEGASHTVVDGFYLGFGVDTDSNGEPSAQASADLYDDGVTFDTPLFIVGGAQVTVRASAPGKLDAWIDYNRNGVWEASEQIFASQPLVAGLNTLPFTVPQGAAAVPGESYARFRFSSAGGLAPGGAATDGEVEDYRVDITQAAWQNPGNHNDVNGDGVVSTQDALLLVNFLYFNGQRPVPQGPGTPPFPVQPPPYYDVNGDNFVTTQDALLVISALRSQAAAARGAQASAPAGSSYVQQTVLPPPPLDCGAGIAAVVPAAAPEAFVGSVGPSQAAASAPSALPTVSAALLLEEMASPSIKLATCSSIVGRDSAAAPITDVFAAVHPATERAAQPARRAALAASAVDRTMASAFEAERFDWLDMEFIEEGSSSAAFEGTWKTVDDFFARFKESEDVAALVGAARDDLDD